MPQRYYLLDTLVVIIIVISKIQDLVVAQHVIRRSKRHTVDINTYSEDHSPFGICQQYVKIVKPSTPQMVDAAYERWWFLSGSNYTLL